MERESVELVYAEETGGSIPFERIPAPDQERLLKKVRSRELEIEEHVTHDMLERALSENRRTPRRFMRVSIGVMMLAFAIIFGVIALLNIFGLAYRQPSVAPFSSPATR